MLFRQDIIRLTPTEEPVTPAGGLYSDQDGSLWLSRFVPVTWLDRLRHEERGDITTSGLYYITFRDVLDTTQLAVDLDLETHKNALYDSVETPNFSTESAFSATNEVTGTNWAAGGVALTGTAVSESPAGTLMFDATDVSVASCTFTGAEGAKLYADALAGNNLILCHDFAATASPTAATFQIQYAAGGLFNIDLTP